MQFTASPLAVTIQDDRLLNPAITVGFCIFGGQGQRFFRPCGQKYSAAQPRISKQKAIMPFALCFWPPRRPGFLAASDLFSRKRFFLAPFRHASEPELALHTACPDSGSMVRQGVEVRKHVGSRGQGNAEAEWRTGNNRSGNHRWFSGSQAETRESFGDFPKKELKLKETESRHLVSHVA